MSYYSIAISKLAHTFLLLMELFADLVFVKARQITALNAHNDTVVNLH